MKLESFSVNGFKSLVNTSAANLSSINMLYGYNNSGKSNILKFLELVFRVKKSEVSDRSQNAPTFYEGVIENTSFFFNTLTNTETISFKFTFQLLKTEIKTVIGEFYEEFKEQCFMGNNHQTIQCKIEGEIQRLNFNSAQIRLQNVLLNNKELLTALDDGGVQFLNFLPATVSPELSENKFTIFGNIMGLFNDCILFLDNDRYFEKENNLKVKFNDLSPRNLKGWLYTLYINPETHKLFLELITFISDFKVTGSEIDLKNTELNSPFKTTALTFAENEDGLMAMLVSNGKRLPLSNFGTGIQQVFYILSKIFASSAKIVLIEELELNLSPKYQKELLRHLRKLINANKLFQVFFSTHSKYLTFRTDFSIYEIKISDHGHTSATKVAGVKTGFFVTRSLD